MSKKSFRLHPLLATVLLFSTPNTTCGEERLSVQLQLDEDGKTSPEMSTTVHWNNDYYSAIAWRERTVRDRGQIDGIAGSRTGTFTDTTKLHLSTLNYESGTEARYYALGFDVNIYQIDKQEFAYFESSGTWIVTDNNVQIDVVQPAFGAEFTSERPGRGLNWRIGASLSPWATLSVGQETLIKPLVEETGLQNSSQSQDLAYTADIEMLYVTGSYIDLGLTYGIDFLPLEYEMAILNTTNDGFTTTTVKSEETATRAGVRLALHAGNWLGGINPVIGVVQESIRTKYNGSADDSETEQTIVIVGIENRF